MTEGTLMGRGTGRGRVRSTLAAVMAVLFLLTFAGIASAHTPNVTLTCANGLKVNLSAYNAGGTNTVSVWIDDVQVGGSPFSYGGSYSNTWAVLPATAAHTAKVQIAAWDDPSGSKGWSKTYDLSIDACQQPTPTIPPTPDPTPTVAPTPVPTLPESTPTPTPVVTPTPVATPSGTVAAETGTPQITPPATDTLGTPSSGSGTGYAVLLGIVGALVLAVLFVTPSRKRNRR